MALQTKTIKADGSKAHHTFTLTVTENSTDTTNNKSNVSFTFKLSPKVKDWDWAYQSSIPVTYTVNIGGTKYTGNIMSYDGVSTVTIKSGTLDIAHNADGTKALSISFSVVCNFDSRVLPGNASSSATMNLTEIPRGATITSAVNFNDEENPTITYSNPAGSAVTSIEACISFDGSKDDIKYREINKTNTVYTFHLTEEERKVLRQGVTKGTSRTVIFYLRTKIGDNTLYSTSYKTFTLLDAIPELTYDCYDVNDTVIALTGNNKKYVPNHSILYWEMQGTAKKEATIAEYEFAVDGKVISNETSGHIDNYNGYQVDFMVTDSRGNYKAAAIITSNTVDYIELTCNQKASIELVGETTAQISVDVSGNYFNGSFGAANNTLTIYYRIAEDGGAYSAWRLVDIEPKYSGNTYSLNYNVTGLAYDKAYNIQTRALDALQAKESNQYPLKLIPVFDWSDTDFNFNVPVYFNNIPMADFIVEQGTTDSWIWRKWNSGKAECYRVKGFNTEFTQTWGNMYQSNQTIARIDYPITFTKIPIETVSVGGGAGYAAWIYAQNGGRNTLTQTGFYKLCRPTTVTAATDFYINYAVFGYWK